MAIQSLLLDYLMANDRLLLKQIIIYLGLFVQITGFHLVVIIAVGVLEMVGIDSNILNRCSEAIFLLFIGMLFFGLIFKKNFGMANAEKLLADIARLRKKNANESKDETNGQTKKDTGKSFSEALILASTNPQYDKRLFIDLPVQYMKTTSSEHVVYINCFFVLTLLTFKTILCTQHVLSL